ncbi:hybrid sensor histidine kinase/response regulator [Methanococcoides sp. FTZ1]|uniref:hybrid sensor histidine kinase/response regulator n=1 Tax=Methanococcoides sp. FTZ1 TaxID=3439061 RepID=UPI003F85E6EB
MNQKERSRILIIGNEDNDIEFLESVLIPDYDISRSHSGKEGLKKAIDEATDLILLDNKIADIAAHEICRIFKSDIRTKLIPIVIVAGPDERDEKTKSLEEGADDFINRPPNYLELTTRVRSLLKIKRLQDNVIKERNQACKYLDVIGSIIMILDGDAKITFANMKACKLLGWKKEELIGKSLTDFFPEDTKEMQEKELFRVLEGKVEIPEYQELPLLTRNNDGTKEKRLILWHDVILKDEERKVIGIIRSGEDNTERMNMEEELTKANEKLRLSHKMKDEFLANINHELRTPLISIKGFSELLYNERLGELNEHQKRTMKTVVRNSERLRHLIESLFYVSDMQNETIRYTFSLMNLKEIIENIVADMLPNIEHKGIKLKTDIPDKLPIVKGNSKYIESVLVHLLDNAIKFTPAGEVISLSASEENGIVHIIVEDTGPGIPNEILSQFCTEIPEDASENNICCTNRDYGLIICKKIVNAHKGEMDINTEKSTGTEIHVRLPIYEKDKDIRE